MRTRTSAVVSCSRVRNASSRMLRPACPRVMPTAATTIPRIPNETALLADPPLDAEKNSEGKMIAPNSPTVAPAIVS